MSTTDKPAAAPDEQKVSDLAKGIEQTRAGMSATISELEHRLSPSELGGKARVELDHIETRVKAAMREGLHEARGVLDEKILAAREAVHGEILEAKGAAKELLDENIKAAKEAIHEEIAEARSAVKEQLHETKTLVTEGLSNARDTLKSDIRGAIAHTKQSMRDATLGRVEDIATKAGDAMNTTRDTLVETIRQNPIPAALAGIGLAWLLMNRSSANRRKMQFGEHGSAGYPGNDHRASDVMHQIGGAIGHAGSAVAGVAHDAASAAQSGMGHGAEAVSHAVDATGRLIHTAGDATERLFHDARDAGGNLVHQAAGAAGNLAVQAQHMTGDLATGVVTQARRVERGLEETMQSNPLALGAVALAVGAAVGYSLPRTQRENELMGEAREHMLEGATHLAHDASQSLMHAASAAGDTVKGALGAATK